MRSPVVPTLLAALLGACGGPSPTPAPPGVTLAITGVTVLPMDGRGALPDRTVLIEGDRILEVRQGRVILPPEVERVAGEGRFLIPGLWDMHVHAIGDAEAFFPLFLEHGVTGVRDMGGDEALLGPARERVASGTSPGPRLQAAGPILDGPGHPWSPPYVVHLETPDDARTAVEALAGVGVDFLKIYSGLTPEVYAVLVEEATARGLPLVGHVPLSVPASEVSRRGQASVEHTDPSVTFLECVQEGSGRFGAALGAWGRDGYGSYLEHLRSLRGDADVTCVESLHGTYRDRGTHVVPTLINHVKDSTWVNWDALPLLDEARLDACLGTLELFHQASDELRQGHHRALLADVGRLHGSGVRVLAGSDVPNACLVPGASLHDELALLVKAGLSPYEALEAATAEAARFLGLGSRFGTVEGGKMADLVLLEGNPLEDIHHSRTVKGVVLGGQYREVSRSSER